jgi:hypothetical protein
MKKGGCRAAIVARMVGSVVVTLASIAGLNKRPAIAQDTPSGRLAATYQGVKKSRITRKQPGRDSRAALILKSGNGRRGWWTRSLPNEARDGDHAAVL